MLRALNCGAQGIVVPHVCSEAEAQQAIAASRYYLLGKRGISGGRTTGFGTINLLRSYLEMANQEIMVVAMIEGWKRVENIDEITAKPSIDMLLEGAVNLSQSLSVSAQVQHPAVQTTVQQVAVSCAQHGKSFCAIPRVDGQYAAWQKQGVHAFLLGDNRGVSFCALKANRFTYKNNNLSL